MKYRADTRQETLDRRQEGLWSNVYSPKSHTRDNSTENFFYFLNGHGDVTYFSDQNFTEEQIETYEYTPWGVLLTSASKNNLLYTAREFDFETGMYAYFSYYFIPSILMFNLVKKLDTEALLSLSFNINYKITKEYKNNIFIKTSYKKNAWWVGPVVVLIAACLIEDIITDCASFCSRACEKSGGVENCKDKLCGQCEATCKDGGKK